MRVNVVIADEVLKKVDARAEQLGMSRSAYVTMATARQLESEELLNYLPKLVEMAGREKVGCASEKVKK